MVRACGSIVLALTVSSVAPAAMVLNIRNFPPGDAKLPGYKGWYPLDSMQFSITRDLPDDGGKGGTSDINIGVGEIGAINLSKPMGAGSAELFQFAIAGNSIGTVDIRLATAGAKSSVPTAAWRLDRAFVASYSMSSSGGAAVEEFSLFFEKIAFAVVVDGTISATGWSRVHNMPWTDHGLEFDLKAELGAAQKALPGDFVLDAVVNGPDFLAWQRGESPSPLSAKDLAQWVANYGAASHVVSTVVPEPAAWASVAWAMALVCGRRRRYVRR